MTTRHRRARAERRQGRRRLNNILLVLAIVSILMTLAVPAVYYAAIRAEIAVALARSEPMLREIAAYRAAHGRFPADNREAGFPPPERYGPAPVASIRVAAEPTPGSLHVRFDIAAIGDADCLVYSPIETVTGVVWSCEHSTLPARLLPARCERRSR